MASGDLGTGIDRGVEVAALVPVGVAAPAGAAWEACGANSPRAMKKAAPSAGSLRALAVFIREGRICGGLRGRSGPRFGGRGHSMCDM